MTAIDPPGGAGGSELGDKELLRMLQQRARSGSAAPGDAVVIAVMLDRLGRPRKAMRVMRLAHEQGDSPLPAGLLGRFSERAGEQEAAKEWYKASLSRGLTAIAATGLARMLSQEHDYRGALELYERLYVAADKVDGELWGALAGAAANVGQFERACDLARDATNAAPSNTNLWRLRASLLREAGNPRAAVRVASAGLRLHPANRLLLAELGLALVAAGRASCARRFRQANEARDAEPS